MNILIAPNAFKDSLDATAAARAIAAGLEGSRLDSRCELFPVGDGGDGTGELLVARLGGERRTTPAHDPLQRPIQADFGLVDGGATGVVEMAAASGLRLLTRAERDPLRATSFGAGELVAAAFEAGARRIVLCVGGSATVDGGAGLLQALGVRFLDAAASDLTNLPAGLSRLETIDLSQAHPQLGHARVTVLCDVENPILGRLGAAAVYGPQKGAGPKAVAMLETALARYCEVIRRQTGRDVADLPRGGAAGGVAAGLFGLANAELVRGIDYFLDVTDFDAAVAKCDLVITGEGRIDSQTLQGKAPIGVAMRARVAGVPVVALAGQVAADARGELEQAFNLVLSIGAGPMGLEEALRRTADDLARTGREIADLIAQGGVAALSRRRSSA